MRGQLSAEMIILVAVVLAVVAIVALSLTKSAERTGGAVENQSEHIAERTGEIVSNFSAGTHPQDVRIALAAGPGFG